MVLPNVFSKRILLIMSVLFSLTACGAHFDSYREIAPEFDPYTPKVIAVLPLSNQSLKYNAPIKCREIFYEELAEKGYYLLPLEMIDSALKELGVDSGNKIDLYTPQKYGEVLGADTLIYGNVREFNTKYLVAYASVTVSLEFKMVEASTGKVLWKAGDKVYDTNLQHLEGTEAALASKEGEKAGAIALAETLAYAVFKKYEPYIEKVVDKILESLPNR